MSKGCLKSTLGGNHGSLRGCIVGVSKATRGKELCYSQNYQVKIKGKKPENRTLMQLPHLRNRRLQYSTNLFLDLDML